MSGIEELRKSLENGGGIFHASGIYLLELEEYLKQGYQLDEELAGYLILRDHDGIPIGGPYMINGKPEHNEAVIMNGVEDIYRRKRKSKVK